MEEDTGINFWCPHTHLFTHTHIHTHAYTDICPHAHIHACTKREFGHFKLGVVAHAFGQLRQEDCRFKSSFGYIVRSLKGKRKEKKEGTAVCLCMCVVYVHTVWMYTWTCMCMRRPEVAARYHVSLIILHLYFIKNTFQYFSWGTLGDRVLLYRLDLAQNLLGKPG